MNLRPIIVSAAEDYPEFRITSSPESYSGPVGKHLAYDHLMALETPLGRRASDVDESARNSMNDAARALQDLHNYRGGDFRAQVQQQQPAVTRKRSRPLSIDHSAALQENVRHLLNRSSSDVSDGVAWSDNLVHSRRGSAQHGSERLGAKRVCCSTDSTEELYHPSMSGYAGPGMWAKILN